MSKQLQKLNYAPEEVEISVIGSSTPTTGSLTITQIKTLLASDQNYIKYTISASASEYLYFTNFTNNTAFYGADLYNATTSVYYRHLIKISYSSDLSSATWNYYNIPIITGSSSDLMSNPMTTANDLIVGGSSGTPTRLAKSGINNYVLMSKSTGLAWEDVSVALSPYGTGAPELVEVAGFDMSMGYTSGQVGHSAISDLPYLTTAPSANNTSGLKIVVLSSEPATKYDGYLYIITE